jgi:hypothetical protein
MYEVCLKLRFDSPCLGNVRGETEEDPAKMMRGPDGNVTFSQTWWRTIVCQGARCYGKHQERVRKILWGSSVDGTTQIHRRYYHLRSETGPSQRMHKDHESFMPGEVIGVKVLVPDDVPIEDFRDIMAIAGEYFGISPFGWTKGFGKFKVVEAFKTRQPKKEEADGKISDVVGQGEPAGGNAG